METNEIEEIEDEVQKNYRLFKNFNIEIDPHPDHHFIDEEKAPLLWNIAKHVPKEWKILKTSLPDSIFVRAL